MYYSNFQLLEESFERVISDEQAKSFFLFAAANNQADDIEALQQLVLNCAKPIIGGVFPEIIADGERYNEGYCLVPLYFDLEVRYYSALESVGEYVERLESDILELVEKAETVFCFADALWRFKEDFINSLYDGFGPFVNYLGGGAGNLQFESRPCLFSNNGIAFNGAVIGVAKMESVVGVAHGWKPISDAIKVTEAKANTVKRLNDEIAFDLYKKQIQGHKGVELTEKAFFDVAKSYPFGMVRLDSEMIIRDPISSTNGQLEIVDKIPKGVYVRIMYGDIESLLKEGSQKALKSVIDATKVDHQKFCVDCISRVLYMQDDFSKELKIINTNSNAFGVLSLGEFANPNKTRLQIFNKTCVLAIWKKMN
jgi:hypothetical protein